MDTLDPSFIFSRFSHEFHNLIQHFERIGLLHYLLANYSLCCVKDMKLGFLCLEFHMIGEYNIYFGCYQVLKRRKISTLEKDWVLEVQKTIERVVTKSKRKASFVSHSLGSMVFESFLSHMVCLL